ncbi:MAG: MotA/TolQ/ExbB proton channel family protein [Pelistega sp.]|nr:MotA/TolQ/ExbB proton channel family protein [Pelistega sp.]
MAFEYWLYQLSHIFFIPVMALIILALLYAFVCLGQLGFEAWQRKMGRYQSVLALCHAEQAMSSDDLELWIMKRLEWLRITSRNTPMLGLIATMIPMGPALLALTQQNTQAVGENMVVAFSSVIIALVGSCLSFLVLTIRRRWLLEELRQIEKLQEPRT